MSVMVSRSPAGAFVRSPGGVRGGLMYYKLGFEIFGTMLCTLGDDMYIVRGISNEDRPKEEFRATTRVRKWDGKRWVVIWGSPGMPPAPVVGFNPFLRYVTVGSELYYIRDSPPYFTRYDVATNTYTNITLPYIDVVARNTFTPHGLVSDGEYIHMVGRAQYPFVRQVGCYYRFNLSTQAIDMKTYFSPSGLITQRPVAYRGGMYIHDGDIYMVGRSDTQPVDFSAPVWEYVVWRLAWRDTGFALVPYAERVANMPEEVDTFSTTLYEDDVYLIGGVAKDGEPYADDSISKIYKSADGGSTWSLITDNPSFGGRVQHAVNEHGGALYLIGGIDKDVVYNDLWKSEDGSTWIKLA